MRKTTRTALALLLALCLCLPLVACTAADKKGDGGAAVPTEGTGDADRAQIAAKVGDYEITKGELIDEYNSMLSFYSSYGMQTPTTDEEIESYQDSALEGLVAEKILLYQAKQQGFSPLTDEQKQEVQVKFDAEIAELMGTFQGYAEEEGAEDVDARTIEMINEALESNGWNMDLEGYKAWLYTALENEQITALLEASIKDGVTVGEEQVRAYYDDLIATQTEKYAATPLEYLTDEENSEMTGGTPILHVPEGFVRIKVISMEPEGTADESLETKKAELADLEAEYGKLALAGSAESKARLAEIQTSYDALAKEIAGLEATHMQGVRDKAAEAVAKLAAGASFDEVLKEYGDDDSYETYKLIGERGRLLMLDGDDGWSGKLHAVVKTLADGEYSGVIEDDGAVYIVQRVGIERAGTMTYEEAKSVIETAAADEAKESAWTEQKELWQADKSVVTYFEDVYRGIGK